MKHADHQHKQFLHPGGFHFSDGGEHLHTLLGSCIAITLWHPIKKIGGMCHFVLPEKSGNMADSELDGRYAIDALELFRRAVSARATTFAQYQAKIFGGSNILENSKVKEEDTIGMRNAEAAFTLLMQAGAEIQVAHVGETGHRRIVFDVETGDVWVRHESNTGKRLTSMSGAQ